MADRWVSTVCDRCYVGCGIRVHVEDDVVVGIEGDPDSPQNRGQMCAKGKAGLMAHYSPYRVKVPLKRTNPEKGIGVDPGWREISWEEALDTIVDRLRRIQDEPQKLFIHAWGYVGDLGTFGAAFGTPNIQQASAHECGKSIHPIEHMAGGGFHQQADLHYCNYCIYVGTNGGVASRASYVHVARDLADAQARGMKLVVVDPVGGYAAAKAEEWVPILPGTDAAFALAFLDVLLNELGIYDAEFLKKRTNAAYLVGVDGRYVRDTASGKPLIFDPLDRVVKTYDDPTIRDFALEGRYEVHGVSATPAFELLKRHVEKFPPEWASEITTIPAGTIRRLAREFGEAAQVGSTIVIEGKRLPYRPAALDWARGPQGHKHGFHHSWALKLINIVVGAVNVPGGIMSTGAAGKNPYHWWPEGGLDGMLQEAGKIRWGRATHPSGFPGREPARPVRQDIFELFPLAGHATTLFPLVGADPAKFGLDYKIEVMMHTLSNAVMASYGDLKVVERFLKSVPFIVGFAFELNETNEFDDVVIPTPSYLERHDFGAGMYYALAPVGEGDWFFPVRQPVVEPPPGVIHPEEVTMEIAERLGILADFQRVLNNTYMIREPYRLEPGQKYSLLEIYDRRTKSLFGPERGLEWLKEQGLVRYPRDVEEAYPGPFINARLPIYLEHFLRRGEELQELIQEIELPWDFSDFKALPEWMPCDSFEAPSRGEDVLIAVNYKLPFTYGAHGNENPWINEICERTPYTYSVLINEDVAKRKGIRDGDAIWVESAAHKAKGTAKVTQCIHPEVVGIAGFFGHWAKGMPISRGKGLAFNSFLPHDLDHIDKISTALDSCVLVKIYKAAD